VDQPPDDVLAILELPAAEYAPFEPAGTPAAPGSDFSGSALTLVSQPGDDFSMPSFWYGDIYAGDDFVGRVDFGATPGGWCARSAGGDKLAFKRDSTDSSGSIRAALRWFRLADTSQVYDPAPQLQVTSQLVWSPEGDRLAFSACEADNQACGLYLLDAATNTVRLLAAVEPTLWDPLWKPDGSQVAVIGSGSGTLFVVGAEKGERVYTGNFDLNAWQPAPNSPLMGWGVSFARNWEGGNCFTK
jgi:dipeptidyl aminopeptidase/acylaminoacyl peptidase